MGGGHVQARKKSMNQLVRMGWIGDSQNVVFRPLWAPEMLSGVLRGQNYFHNYILLDFIAPFHCIDICTNDIKTLVGKTAGTVAESASVAPDCTCSHGVLTPCTGRGERASGT